MTTGGVIHEQQQQQQNLEKHIEKQMGCMTGFLHFFDRTHILHGKRIYTTRRYQTDCSSQSESSIGSPGFSGELRPQQQHHHQSYKNEKQKKSSPPVDLPLPPPVKFSPEIPEALEIPPRMSSPLPVFEYKEGFRSSWKFKESPRLSLDSRAVVDGKGSIYPKEIRTSLSSAKNDDEGDKQRRSPSVIARLMGLDALPDSGREPIKKVELRRSASESRVSRDLRFNEGSNLQVKNVHVNPSESFTNNVASDQRMKTQTPSYQVQKGQSGRLVASPWKSQQQQQRKSYFDSQDFFPGPKHSEALYGEIEKRLRLRGIDEPAKDLETLKQILEALQLKGLLHLKKEENARSRNLVFDKRFSGQLQVSINRNGRAGVEPAANLRSKHGVHRNLNFPSDGLPPIRRNNRLNVDRNNEKSGRNVKLNEQNLCSEKSPSSLARRRASNVELPRRNELVQQRKISPIQSPRLGSKKMGAEQNVSKSPRNRRSNPDVSTKERIYSTPIDDEEPSSISESSRSSSSQVESERTKLEDYKEGKSLLERCDKLLNSIAEITTSNEIQPSPVSVLDSSFYKDESSPSPIMKRCIDFKDPSVEVDDEKWSPPMSPVRLASNDSDYHYVSEILRASSCLSEDTDVFWLVEKQYKTNSSDSSTLHRKMVFDIIIEILDKKARLPPWKAFSITKCTTDVSQLQQIWIEFQRIQEKDPAEDLFEVIGGVIKKDMAEDYLSGWSDTTMQTPEAVLDIERMIFKDLVVETIQDLASFGGKNDAPFLRRKLVF